MCAVLLEETGRGPRSLRAPRAESSRQFAHGEPETRRKRCTIPAHLVRRREWNGFHVCSLSVGFRGGRTLTQAVNGTDDEGLGQERRAQCLESE